jgi:hypothetical protein
MSMMDEMVRNGMRSCERHFNPKGAEILKQISIFPRADRQRDRRVDIPAIGNMECWQVM